MEAHIGTCWSFNGVVMKMISGDGATSSSHLVTQSMRNGAFLREVSSHCSICTSSIVNVQLGLSTLLSNLSQPQRVRFGEWWMRWELHPRTLIQASYIFQGQSNSHRPWVGVV